jgi:hypothetical protein
MNLNDLFNEEKVRLDPKCWTGKKIGNPKTKVKGGVRVNNCVPAESVEEGIVEGMAGKVVFSGTGANGSTYEIIQSSPTDFMIHTNGRHIDTYGSLQRAMSVLKNEVPGLQQGMAEGKADYNFDIEDLKRLEQIRDLATLKAQALELISKPSAKPMKPEKVEWFRNALERMNSPLKVIKLMYDLLLSGEGKAVVGTRSSMNPNTYRQRFGEQGMAEGKKPEHIDETEDLSMYDPKIQQAVKSGRLDLADAAWMNDYYKTPGDSRLETGKGAFKDQSQKMQNFVDRMKSGEIPVHSQFKDTMELRGTVARQAKQGGGMGGGGGMGKRPGDLDNKFNPLKLENVIDKQGMAENNAVNVPPGWQATTQPDGSTRISKPGSVSRADYAKNMAAYKAQTQTPEKIADFKQRMASGQGYTDTERSSNYQQQKKSFGDYADTPLDEQGMTEVSLGDYRKKAAVSQAGAKINRFFDRDDPEKVAAADQTIAKREKGLSRADARSRPYTAPPVDKEKQRQQLTDKYPNIDQLVSDAEKNRDPYYDRAEGNAYYAGREAEQNYVRLKQIQRIIQGLNEETRQATLSTPAGDFTADITKDKSTNTVSGKMNVRGVNIGAVKDMTPGGAQSVSADMDVAPGLNISATRKSADYNKGQLAGTKSVSAKYTDTAGALGKPGQQHTATRTTGIGFGGASGPRVGKNYVDQIDKTLADYMKEAKGINSIRNPNDLQPLEAGGGMGGGGGRTTSGPSPFGPKPGSREASIAQPNPNTMTVKQGPNPDYVPPKTLQQKYDDLNKKLDQLPPAPPVKTPRPGRAAADQRRTDQAQAAELKDVVPLSPAERDRLRPVDANKVRQSELNKEPPDLSNVRPGLDEESRKKREQPEVEYDDDYDAMVARVKKLAGLGPMKTVYDPKKRQYRNMPTAQQPKK